MNLAEKNEIKIAYSNDAFEVWLLLHFIYLDAALDRKTLKNKLGKLLNGYKKGKPGIYKRIKQRGGGIDVAIKHSKKLLNEQAGISPVDADPLTTVHLLVEKLQAEFVRDSR